MWRIYIQRDNLYGTNHYGDVIMSMIASQITSLTIVYSTVFFRHRSKKTSKLRFTGPCAGNSPGTGEFPAQMTSNAENVSIWWRHHEIFHSTHWPSGKVTLILTLVQAMSGCHHATIHYLSQWWLGSVSLSPGRSELMASQWLHTTHPWINGWRYQDKHVYMNIYIYIHTHIYIYIHMHIF